MKGSRFFQPLHKAGVTSHGGWLTGHCFGSLNYRDFEDSVSKDGASKDVPYRRLPGSKSLPKNITQFRRIFCGACSCCGITIAPLNRCATKLLSSWMSLGTGHASILCLPSWLAFRPSFGQHPHVRPILEGLKRPTREPAPQAVGHPSRGQSSCTEPLQPPKRVTEQT